jgi:ABC-type nickel/cobalt efflux system permease component RcnA
LVLILPLGIAFGAVHALTPGHGKTVLASSLVGSRLVVL